MDRGLAALPDDERTIARLVVAQAEFADLLVYAGELNRVEGWRRARTDAVLARLTPLAPRIEAAALASPRCATTVAWTAPPLLPPSGNPTRREEDES